MSYKTTLQEHNTKLQKSIDKAAALPDAETNVVKYTAQTLTDEQKAQARENVGAASAEEVGELSDKIKNYVPKNQGAANVGKILAVGTDGNLVLVDMPDGSGDVTGVLDESNNILLSGNLADGTYQLKWQNADGTYSDAGTIVVSTDTEPDTPTIINLAEPDATATGEAAWNSGGWCNDSYMAGSSYAYRAATDGRITTNTFAVEYGDTIYVKGIKYAEDATVQIAAFDADGTYIKHGSAYNMFVSQGIINGLTGTIGADYWYFNNGTKSDMSDVGTRFIRLAGVPSGSISDIIITRNQPIE